MCRAWYFFADIFTPPPPFHFFSSLLAQVIAFKVGIKGRSNDISRHAHVLVSAILSLMYFLYVSTVGG